VGSALKSGDYAMTRARYGAAWLGADLERSGEHLIRLSEAEVARLAEELPSDFRVSDLDGYDELRSRVAKPLGQAVATLLDRLGPAGPGLGVVTGNGLEDLDDGQLTALVFGLSVLLGRPMAQNAEDELIVSVHDQKPADLRTARGYTSNDKMLMHTDPTDVAGLLCLRQSAVGGAGLFIDAATIHEELERLAPDTIPEYHRPWTWDLRGMQRPGADRLVPTPIFSTHRGLLSCRYGSLMVREGARATGGLTDEAAAVLDRFEEIAQRPELCLRYALSRGESVWLNNYRVLHGRERFEDRAERNQVRHLLRTWVWLHDRPPLADDFTAFAAAMDRG
jgi:hypothetical protein